MNATLATQNPNGGKNYGGEKELINAYSIVAHDGDELHEAVVLRVYMGRSRTASRVYASLWAFGPHGAEIYTAGHGQAGGGGYHKASAATHDAIKAAGFELSESIHGRGTEPMLDALQALAVAMGYSGPMTTIRH